MLQCDCPGTVGIMYSLEVLGDLAGVHAAPADSVLVFTDRHENLLVRIGRRGFCTSTSTSEGTVNR
jgi:hypothetical protein